jgi:hypothetical protein
VTFTVEIAQQYGAIGLTIGTISARRDVIVPIVSGHDDRGLRRRNSPQSGSDDNAGRDAYRARGDSLV